MPIELVGILPVSAVNTGLESSASIGLGIASAKLSADLNQFGLAATANNDALATLPDEIDFGVAIQGETIADIELAFASMPSLTVDLSGDISTEYGTVLGQLSILGELSARLELGLGAGNLWGWSYSGGSSQFGRSLESATASGFGHAGPNDSIDAVIIATENGSTWREFGKGFATGNGAPGLTYMGDMGAEKWSPSVADLRSRLGLLKLELDGIKTQLEASLKVAAGLNLPDPTAVLDLGASIITDFGVDGLLANLGAGINVAATIADINADIGALAALTADLNAQLSAGGLCVWKYSGPVKLIGTEFAQAIRNGVPLGNGPDAGCYGLAIGGSGSVMAAFGSIFI